MIPGLSDALNCLNKAWEPTKLKYVALLNPKCSFDETSDGTVSFVPMECVKCGMRLEKAGNIKDLSGTYSTFNNGDIALAKVTPCFENGNICMMENLIGGFAYGSSELFCIRPVDILPRYLFYVLQSHDFIEGGKASMTGTGGLKRISSQFVKNYSFPKPPINVQKRIAAYLDEKLLAIDSIISEAHSLIDDYKKLKVSVIYEAVSKGIELSLP